jgi:hypothetical protein
VQNTSYTTDTWRRTGAFISDNKFSYSSYIADESGYGAWIEYSGKAKNYQKHFNLNSASAE